LHKERDMKSKSTWIDGIDDAAPHKLLHERATRHRAAQGEAVARDLLAG
jgi:hypothetical protein